MKRTIIPVLVAVALGVAGCSSADASHSRSTAVAAFFPLAATLRALGGSSWHVRDLTPAGVEPHDLELTSDAMDAILDAKLVVLMGRGFQPAVEAGARRRSGATVEVLRTLGTGSDPHIWLDPVLMRRTVGVIAGAVVRAIPAERAHIRARQSRLDGALHALDDRYRRELAHCDRHVIVTAHEAFGYLARRYGLRQEAIAGISPEQEPDARRLAELTDLVRRDHVTTVFTERLVSPRVADTLAREAGVKTAVLDPIESPTGADSFDRYLGAMRQNLTELRTALQCR